jgi:hypothetical protein
MANNVTDTIITDLASWILELAGQALVEQQPETFEPPER